MSSALFITGREVQGRTQGASLRNCIILEHWNTGTLEHWNTGTLEHWNISTKRYFYE
ncbi:hypothetical protein VU04_02275 [Desulfobulbus sp. TB]|nr:hypothetical protein [Desulfobulbus sp. TB]